MAAVEQIADTVRAGADDSEDQRRVTPRSLAALRDSGLLAALVPAETGGFQVDPLTELELIEAVTFLDGSTGWTYWALAGSTARTASMLPPKAVAEVFPPGGPVPLIAFQERHFDNRARPTPEGLRVSGRWPFGTGASHADWVLAMAGCIWATERAHTCAPTSSPARCAATATTPRSSPAPTPTRTGSSPTA
ncbi:hypothetical protein [Umezawaea sp. Da 62-37]|uniref:hypothetical protein n=1 Tax=Umezawaea sp. Da 62-37 TaxID=3075927 RepID=UPI0028F70FC5|nr:hypothetical protein [Umezawaea sp. Da 62-37]WNV83025.1 hypothetical protein RM788_33195 [Umezawaea sp. Da 62-37]